MQQPAMSGCFIELVLCLGITLLSLASTTVRSESLFAPDGAVIELTPEDFVPTVHHSPKLWIVTFYAAWCGHCQRVAPVYARFADDILAWQSIVGVAAVACSDPTNAQLCRDYGVSGFPDIRLFLPHSTTSEHGTKLERDKLDFEKAILRYLTLMVNQHQVHPSWPYLGFVRHPNDLRFNSTDTRPAYIIVEDEASANKHIGLTVVLDLLPLRSLVLVGRMKLSEAEVYGITGGGLFGATLFNSLFPVESSFDRQSLVETIRRHVVGPTDGRPIASTVAVATEQTADGSSNTLTPGLHMQDIESSLYYSLWVEVATRTSLDTAALNALKMHINTMLEYLPGESHIMNFLERTNNWLKSQSAPLSTTMWLHQITNTQTDDAYVPSRLRWTWCHGSKPQFRGYPCSLWMTFHALTVNAYVNYLNKGSSFSPSIIIESIRTYIEQFLGCRQCAANFARGASRALVSAAATRYLTQPDGPALWLWYSHNRANEHLHGDITEDPLHPKIQFPSSEACPDCWTPLAAAAMSTPPSAARPFNETAVLGFLLRYYGAPYVIDDDIHDTEAAETLVVG